MALTSKRRYPNAVARRKISGVGAESNRPRRTPITVVSVVPGDTSVITFDQVITCKGVAGYTNNDGHLALTSEITAPNELTVTFPGADTTTTITIPFEDPCVRNGAGGYVVPGTFSAD